MKMRQMKMKNRFFTRFRRNLYCLPSPASHSAITLASDRETEKFLIYEAAKMTGTVVVVGAVSTVASRGLACGDAKCEINLESKDINLRENNAIIT